MKKNFYTEKVLQHLGRKREASISQIAKAQRINRHTVARKLLTLQAEGKVELLEKGRAKVYRLKGGESIQ